MVKTAPNDTYLEYTTPTALKNEVSTFWEIYDDKETWVMINQLVNDFTPVSSLKLMYPHKM